MQELTVKEMRRASGGWITSSVEVKSVSDSSDSNYRLHLSKSGLWTTSATDPVYWGYRTSVM